MRVLVTGGAGFIGSHVVDQLICEGHEVRALDLLLPTAHDDPPGYLNPDAEYQWADVSDPDAVRHAIAGVEAVSHQAAMVGLGVDFADAPAYVTHNDLGTAVLLAALHEQHYRGRLVLASSMVVYGEGRYRCAVDGDVRPGPRDPDALEREEWDPLCPYCKSPLRAVPITEAARLDPRNVYAATKLHQEHLCFAFGHEQGIPVTALRYHNVYGPRMPRDTPYAGVAAIFRSALEASRPPRVFEDGGQLRDFVHVEDVARANVLALTVDAPWFGALNVASGDPRTILDLAVAISATDTSAPSPEVVGGFRRGDVRHVYAATALARRALGFAAAVPFERGTREFASAPLRA